MNWIIDLLIGFLIISKVNLRVISIDMKIYCSTEFLLDGQSSRLCVVVQNDFIILNNSFQVQENDCPSGYFLDSFEKLFNKTHDVLLYSSCSNITSTWDLNESNRAFLCSKYRRFLTCPEGWSHNSSIDFCYLYNSTSVTWDIASNYCNSLGGNLLTIRNQIEFEFFQPFSVNQRIWVNL